jgi:hypothetical protein
MLYSLDSVDYRTQPLSSIPIRCPKHTVVEDVLVGQGHLGDTSRAYTVKNTL